MSLKCEQLRICEGERVLVDAAFELGSSLALVGRSGSGKSLTLKALMGLLPSNLKCQMRLDAPFEMDRARNIGFIPQNPFTALSPMTKIGAQFFAPNAHEALRLVGLDGAYLGRFPSELSGGQLQRVIIAMAVARNPKLMLLDEPTTALDYDTKEQIVQLLIKLQKEQGFLMLFVTHELSLAGRLCREVAVMNSGRIVESGDAREVFENPVDRYTKALCVGMFERRGFRE
jgi:peptide/nickel transport system ATP-binding protein